MSAPVIEDAPTAPPIARGHASRRPSRAADRAGQHTPTRTQVRHRFAVLPSVAESRATEAPAPRSDEPPATTRDQDPAVLCADLALCIVEILAGARPLDQIARWVSDAVFVDLLRRTVIAARTRAVTAQEARRPRVRVGTPLLSRPADGVVDAVVVVHQQARSRAIALRLERHRARWRATVVTVL